VADEFQRLVAGLLPRLRRFGLALTGSAADADDLVQNACERALRRADQLRDHARMDAWIYHIMRNLWVDEVRSRRVRAHDGLDAAAEVIGLDGVAAAEGHVTLAAVRRCLAALSAEHRAVLVLVCVDGFSYRETAAVLGVPIGTVMSRLSRARLDLHALLATRGGASADNVLPIAPGRGHAGASRGMT
jgi:RNA polymerase sigma-70 factor (ECF subfamily)